MHVINSTHLLTYHVAKLFTLCVCAVCHAKTLAPGQYNSWMLYNSIIIHGCVHNTRFESEPCHTRHDLLNFWHLNGVTCHWQPVHHM